MKVFDCVERFDSKVNFVDENNVFLGYDMSEDDRQEADWFIADKPRLDASFPEDSQKLLDLSGWVFDPSYFQAVSNDSVFDGGGMVIFRIVKGIREKFIHLYNIHNGYYGNGFDFIINSNVTRTGKL